MERPENSGKDIINSENLKGDFDFFDLLRIFWKRRYIILFGTAAIVVIIAVVSFSTPEIYRSQMVLKPGLSHFNKKEKWVFITTPAKMKSFIEGELQYKLEQQIRELKEAELSLPLNYKILADNSKNTLLVIYDSPTPDEGVAKLGLLLDSLKEAYQHKLQPFLIKYESEIALAQKELVLILKEQEFINVKLSDIQKSLEKIDQKKNMGDSNPKSPNNRVGYLVNYSSVVERISRLKQIQSKNDLKNVTLNEEKRKLENEKRNLEALRVIQSPTTISVPSRTNLKLNLVASPAIGFFLMIFLVFFVEYVRNLITKIKQKKIFV